MDPGVLIGLGFLWFLLNVFGKKKPGGTRPRPPTPRSSTGADPTQREGARLQDLLRELGKTLDQSAGSRGRPSATRPAPTPKAEHRTPLESVPEVKSLEVDVRRPQRVEVDTDDEAEAIIARRRAEADANARPLGDTDHRTFDTRIRQEPADATATEGYSTRRLRNAVVWREILGPPVSERDRKGL